MHRKDIAFDTHLTRSGYGFALFYRKRCKEKKWRELYKSVNHKKMVGVANAIMETISKHITSYEGGVLIPNVGYIANMLSPTRHKHYEVKYNKNRDIILNMNNKSLGGLFYFTSIFSPRSSPLKEWDLSYGLYKRIKMERLNHLLAGGRYYCYADIYISQMSKKWRNTK